MIASYALPLRYRINIVVLRHLNRDDAKSSLRVLAGIQIPGRRFRLLTRAELDGSEADHTLLQVAPANRAGYLNLELGWGE